MTQDNGANRPVSPVLAGTTSSKERTVLLADDDAAFRNRIARALELRGFIVTSVGYLAKPADADAIEQALVAHGRKLPPPPSNPMSADRVRWEHIQRVFEQCDRNVSETARRLNMHRRTLQRILGKPAPREH